VTRRLLVSAQPGELRAAWIDGERLVALLVLRDDHPSLLGHIYRGRVATIDRGLEAAFVDIGTGADGLLPLAEAPGTKLTEGMAVTVRVMRDARAEKGPRLTARLRDAPPDLEARAREAKPPQLLARGADPVARLLGSDSPPDEILVDHPDGFADLRARLAAARPALAASVKLDLSPEPLFERPFLDGEGVEEAIEALLQPEAALPSGGRLLIEPTRAMIGIDVDSAGHRRGGAGQVLALAVDLEAAAEIPRQLRLRALSGLVVIDFLELRSRADRKQVVETLRAGAKDDREPCRVVAMSASGLVEMTRRRGAPALHEILTAPCGLAGSGRVKTPATVAFEALRAARRVVAHNPGAVLTVRMAPRALAALDGPAAAARADLEARLGQPLRLVPEADPEAPDYEIVTGR
jgi:Ribonuclease G/E